MTAVDTLLVLLFSMLGAQIWSTQIEVQAGSQIPEAAAAAASASAADPQLAILGELIQLKYLAQMLGMMVENMNAEQQQSQSQLKKAEAQIKDLQRQNRAQGAELATMKTEVKSLQDKITQQPKVAFSAALPQTGFTESGNTLLNVFFSNIITKVGQGYSAITGFFTAPVRWVYYFRFTTMETLTKSYMDTQMFKNGMQVMWLYLVDDKEH
ncbi:hypothetical protein ACEWY4_022951 [Coilia grayii]|uniref:C1q domain-containing protein n=1 Tax=Coilia grayii TaxID=363190 RepID=A0ABD1J1L8_9TELE